MKVTYKFINNLMLLLKNPHWQEDLQQRIAIIQKDLSESRDKCNQEIEKMKSKWDLLKKQERITPSPEKQKELIAKKIQSFEDQGEKLTKEQMDIEKCLKVNQYKLGLGVFENVKDAALLLTNIHLLYSKELTADFNPDAVMAVRSMLQENFSTLYSYEIDKSFYQFTAFSFKETDVEKFLSGKLDTYTRIQDFYPSYDEIPTAIQQQVKNYFNLIVHSNPNLVIYSYKKLKPFMDCYPDCSPHLRDQFIFLLSAYFSSPRDIDYFLETEVDFSSSQTLEDSLMLSSGNLSISTLPWAEKEIWQSLNAKFGKKALKLFFKGHDFNKVFSVSAAKIIAQYAEEDSFTSLDILFQIAQYFAEQITFARERENIELAKLSREYNFDEDTFNRMLDEVLLLKKTSDFLPDVRLQIGDQGKYSFEKLPAGDLRGLFLGKMTACCQFIGGDSERCVIDGFSKENAGFYVFTTKKGQVKAQAYAWIGSNGEGQKVLVLDSFEYLPGFEKYFVDLVKTLSMAIQKDGFKELYVGTGGKTPHLTCESTDKVVAKDAELFRYQDSTFLYKIDTSRDLNMYNKNDRYNPNYKNFFELIKYNPYLSCEQIRERDISKKLQKGEIDEYPIICSAIILSTLLEDGSITIEQIAELFSKKIDGLRTFRFDQYFYENIQKWKTALKYYKPSELNYDDFVKVLGISPDILEPLGSILPAEALSLIHEYSYEPTVTHYYPKTTIAGALVEVIPKFSEYPMLGSLVYEYYNDLPAYS